MAENKTQPTKASVTAFVKSIDDPRRRADVRKVAAMMRRATGKRPRMWGSSIVGYGTYHYKYASGREGDFMLTGKSCLYIKRLEDIDESVLEQLIAESVKYMRDNYETW
jgi:hypothetical protein